jgi:hypothetical protein
MHVYGFTALLCLCVRQKATGRGKSGLVICKQAAYRLACVRLYPSGLLRQTLLKKCRIKVLGFPILLFFRSLADNNK